jgi:hypothetical protein
VQKRSLPGLPTAPVATVARDVRVLIALGATR